MVFHYKDGDWGEGGKRGRDGEEWGWGREWGPEWQTAVVAVGLHATGHDGNARGSPLHCLGTRSVAKMDEDRAFRVRESLHPQMLYNV